MLRKKRKRRVEVLIEEILVQADFIIELQDHMIAQLERWFFQWEKERVENARRFELQLKELQTQGPVKEIRNEPIEKELLKIR